MRWSRRLILLLLIVHVFMQWRFSQERHRQMVRLDRQMEVLGAIDRHSRALNHCLNTLVMGEPAMGRCLAALPPLPTIP